MTILPLTTPFPSALVMHKLAVTAKCLTQLEGHAPSSMSSWGVGRGWCCAQVLPAWLTPVSSVPVPGFTASAAAPAHSRAHLWSAHHKMPISTGAGSNGSFSKTRVLATVLKFHVEYSPVCVCAFCYLPYLLRSIKAKCLCQFYLFVFDNCWCHFTFVCKWKSICCWVTEEGKT